VGLEQVEGSLHGLSKGPRTRDELAEETFLPSDQLAAALTRSVGEGDVSVDSEARSFRLTDRGEHHLRVLRARRNEGEDHVEALTELGVFLGSRGIALTVPKQVGGLMLPDGQFQWGDSTYNVEVECSTVAKASGQVIRNVKKARDAGHGVLIVLRDQASVPRMLTILDGAFPGLRLWPDGVGVVWKAGRAAFRPCRVPGTKVWPFLDSQGGLTDTFDAETAAQSPPGSPIGPVADTDPLARCIRSIGIEMLARGKTEATSKEIREMIPLVERPGFTEHHIGSVMALLGLTSRRVWVNGARPRVYDLRRLSPDRIPGGQRAGDRTAPNPPLAGPELLGRELGRGPDEDEDSRRADRSGPTN
jgi:hypothetical protein